MVREAAAQLARHVDATQLGSLCSYQAGRLGIDGVSNQNGVGHDQTVRLQINCRFKA